MNSVLVRAQLGPSPRVASIGSQAPKDQDAKTEGHERTAHHGGGIQRDVEGDYGSGGRGRC